MEITVFGIRVRIGFSFFWLLALLLCYDFRDEIKLALLFSVLHEAGHFAAILMTHQRPEQLRLGLFGMTIVRSGETTADYKQEIITAFAGPLVNLLLSIAFIGIYYLFSEGSAIICAAINLAIAAFNLLPVFSLDGGRIFECFVLMRFGPEKAQPIIKAVSLIFIALIDCFGVMALIKSEYNFTLLIIGIYLTVLLFIKC